jgi:hypothetical protein
MLHPFGLCAPKLSDALKYKTQCLTCACWSLNPMRRMKVAVYELPLGLRQVVQPVIEVATLNCSLNGTLAQLCDNKTVNCC